jgi:uncharacterized spore protein YtfJ
MFKENVEAILASLNNMVSSKTIIGDPINQGNTTIIPILTASFGFGLGDGEGSEPSRGTGKGSGGGAGAKLTPTALIIMQNDDVKIYSLSHKGTIEKVAELVPVILSKMKKPGEDA